MKKALWTKILVGCVAVLVTGCAGPPKEAGDAVIETVYDATDKIAKPKNIDAFGKEIKIQPGQEKKVKIEF